MELLVDGGGEAIVGALTDALTHAITHSLTDALAHSLTVSAGTVRAAKARRVTRTNVHQVAVWRHHVCQVSGSPRNVLLLSLIHI